MPPDHREEVHQALLDPVELFPQVWHPLPQPLDALALEARVVRHDPARPPTGLDQRLGECRPRILRPAGNPLMVCQTAAALLYMYAELHRHLLPRPARRPARD